MTDEKLIEAMARSMAVVYAKDSMLSGCCDFEEPNERDYEAATAALAAYRQFTQDDGK